MGGHKSLTDGLNKLSNHARIEDELKANIAKAKANGIQALICFSGNRHGIPDAESIAICADGLAGVKKDAEDAGGHGDRDQSDQSEFWIGIHHDDHYHDHGERVADGVQRHKL